MMPMKKRNRRFIALGIIFIVFSVMIVLILVRNALWSMQEQELSEAIMSEFDDQLEDMDISFEMKYMNPDTLIENVYYILSPYSVRIIVGDKNILT